MAFDRSQVEAVIQRALELDDVPTTGMDAAAVLRVGEELGVSSEAMIRALAEVTSDRPGPLSVSAQATIAVSAAGAETVLDAFLRLRGLASTGSAVGQQETGWWPDLYRFWAQARSPRLEVSFCLPPGWGCAPGRISLVGRPWSAASGQPSIPWRIRPSAGIPGEGRGTRSAHPPGSLERRLSQHRPRSSRR